MEFFENPKIDRIFDLFLSILMLAIAAMTIYLVYETASNKKTTCLESVGENISFIEESNEPTINTDNEDTTESEVYVDIKGAIKNPGVYKVSSDSIVNDIIKLAGGLKSNASTQYLNLSKKVQNEMVITIFTTTQINNMDVPKSDTCTCPTEDISTCKDYSIVVPESSPSQSNQTQTSDKPSTSNKVSINNATKEELMTLNGIGESKADAIIEYREKNNGFKTLEELTNVSGIGSSAYEKIKDNITL